MGPEITVDDLIAIRGFLETSEVKGIQKANQLTTIAGKLEAIINTIATQNYEAQKAAALEEVKPEEVKSEEVKSEEVKE